jgi:predicted ATP-binding protein involved in virulence
MKLRKLHIEDYKMFKDFDISFVDENDEALPIIVLAGVNGSGKTSLLEYIYKTDFSVNFQKNKNQDNLEVEDKGKKFNSNEKLFKIESLYGKANKNLTPIKKILPKYIENMIFVDGIAPFDSYKQVREYINETLKDLNIQIEFDSRDGEGNLFFRNKGGGDKFSIDELSTGEKTLMSKVLYLYIKDIKDKVILIDEPELSLHPSWQNKVLKIYENFAIKNNCQIIIATHSPHIIGSAKNKYLRFLRKDDEGKIEVVDNITAYGRDIEWILEEMGVEETRLPKITKRFDEIQELINIGEFNKADDELDKLEYVIGDNDKGILALRNDLAFERMDFEEDN